MRLNVAPHGEPAGSRYQTWKKRSSPALQPPSAPRPGPQAAGFEPARMRLYRVLVEYPVQHAVVWLRAEMT